MLELLHIICVKKKKLVIIMKILFKLKENHRHLLLPSL